MRRTATNRGEGLPRPLLVDWNKVGLGQQSDKQIARELGIHPSIVGKYRRKLGISSIKEVPDADWDHLPFGIDSDACIAAQVGVCRELVRRERVRRNIPSIVIDWDSQPLGEIPDRALAFHLGRNPSTVHEARVLRGIPRADLQYETQEGEPANHPEAIVDLYWHRKGIPHEFQVPIGPYRADWVIHRETVVEYAGFSEHKKLGDLYQRRLAQKISFYRKQGWEVLVITPNELEDYGLGLLPTVRAHPKWDGQPLGKKPDSEIASSLGVLKAQVRRARVARGIPAYQKVNWNHVSWELSDMELAEKLGVSKSTVWRHRGKAKNETCKG